MYSCILHVCVKVVLWLINQHIMSLHGYPIRMSWSDS